MGHPAREAAEQAVEPGSSAMRSTFLSSALGVALAILPGHAAQGAGAVIEWGFGSEVGVPPSLDGTDGIASAIAAGGDRNCAIQAGTGAVVCWGSGDGVPPPSVDG